MVNSTKITVSKLSKLQKLILSKLEDHPLKSLIQPALAHEIAVELGGEDDRNRKRGEHEEWILTGNFKASFYRSIKRLEERDMIKRYNESWFDDIDEMWRYRTIIAVEGK